MLATQLLRILETVPSDVKCQTCAPDMIVKENRNEGRGVDLLIAGRKELYQLKGTEDNSKPKLSDDLSMDDHAVAGGELMHCNENEPSDCRPSCIAASELIVCSKEMNYDVVKDICVGKGKTANGISKGLEITSVDSTELPSERSLDNDSSADCNEKDIGTSSFLTSLSFLDSLDDEGNKVQELPHQQLSTTLTEATPKKGVRTSNLSYDSKVERRSITFNFNSKAPVVGNVVTNEETEVANLDTKDMDALDQSLSYEKSAHMSSNSSNSGSLDVASLHRYDRGESSFSADDFITHSGPIAFSGSVSLHSDGSATSGRSFAFPVLQSEWNSSPVRMTEAERRRFRRHKGWRSGHLCFCCRF